MLTITKPGALPKSQAERRAEVIRVHEELEALDRIADSIDTALVAVLELTKTAATNPAKFRSALVVGMESADALTKQLGIVRSQIATTNAYLTEITKDQPLEIVFGLKDYYTADEMRDENAREARRAQESEIISRGVSAGWRPSDILAALECAEVSR